MYDHLYADTHQRLAGDPEYRALKAAADFEERETPNYYLARNRFALYIEVHTPMEAFRSQFRPFRGDL